LKVRRFPAGSYLNFAFGSTDSLKLGAKTAQWRRLLHIGLLTMALLPIGVRVLAQGGPPMAGDDPGTPGAGHWELNFAGIATHRAGETLWDVPDIDVNYGWGDYIQLKFDTPYVLAENRAEPATSGLGSSIFGFKWRFLGRQDAEFAMSLYPQLTTHLVHASVTRGTAEPGSEWLLPVEALFKVGGYDLDAEVARRLLGDGQRGWDVGFILVHDCLSDVECLLELRESWFGRENLALVNIGSRWKLTEAVSVLAAVGHEFGSAPAQPRDVQIYLGVQLRVK
jgi:hypothetical protein